MAEQIIDYQQFRQAQQQRSAGRRPAPASPPDATMPSSDPETTVQKQLLAAVQTMIGQLSRIEALLAAQGAPAELEDEGPPELREGVTPEQAADQIIRLIEASPRALPPSELAHVLRLDIETVLEGVQLLNEKGWLAFADEED